MAAKGRDLVKMSEAEVAEFLTESKKVQVATVNPDGSPHLTTLFYVLQDGRIAFWTYGRSQKIKNLERDPRITCLVETGDDYFELRGVSVSGTAEIVTDEAGIREIGTAVASRMVDGADLETKYRETLLRLAQEPGRLWRRYVVDMGGFTTFFLRQWWLMRQGNAPATVLPTLMALPDALAQMNAEKAQLACVVEVVDAHEEQPLAPVEVAEHRVVPLRVEVRIGRRFAHMHVEGVQALAHLREQVRSELFLDGPVSVASSSEISDRERRIRDRGHVVQPTAARAFRWRVFRAESGRVGSRW